MIELSLTSAFLIYFSVALLGIFSLWVIGNKKSRTIYSSLYHQEIQRCEYCHYPYLKEKTEQISQCPQCRSFNKKGE